jgi:hypothetical protein
MIYLGMDVHKESITIAVRARTRAWTAKPNRGGRARELANRTARLHIRGVSGARRPYALQSANVPQRQWRERCSLWNTMRS